MSFKIFRLFGNSVCSVLKQSANQPQHLNNMKSILISVSLLFAILFAYSAAFGASTEELKANLEKMMADNAEALKAPTPSKDQYKSLNGIVEAADEILKQNPPDETLVWTHTQKTKALLTLLRTNPRVYLAVAGEYLGELDKTPGCAETARLLKYYVLLGRLEQMSYAKNTAEADFNTLIEEAVEFVTDNPGVASERLSVSLLLLGKVIPERNPQIDTSKVAELFRELAPKLKTRQGVINPENAVKMNHLVKMYDLQGTVLELKSVNLKGDQFDIASLRGKVVLIDVWATWCAPCKAAFPKMKTIYEKYKDDGFEILGLSADEAKTMPDLLNDTQRLNLPWIIVSETKALNDRQIPKFTTPYGITVLPTMILVGKDGKVVNSFVSLENLESELDKYLGKNQPKDPMQLPKLGNPVPPRSNSGFTPQGLQGF